MSPNHAPPAEGLDPIGLDDGVPPEDRDRELLDDLWRSWGPWRTPVALVAAGALLAGLVLRFWTRSQLWLDEALSVNIARLPIGDIPSALRQDGHPPLYYVLLHGWMSVVGTGNAAVRSFSGLWAVALIGLLWVAGRRLGGERVAATAVVLVALNPYAIRYATETRMYAMVAVLVLVWALLVDDALRSPRMGRLVAIALVTGALLWTHYWALWFLGAAGLGLLWRWWHQRRDGDPRATATLGVVGATVAGGLTFVPWLPAMAYQGTHTGTPWARPVRPTEMMATTLADFGGGAKPEAIVLGWFLFVAMLLGLFGIATGRLEITLDLRTRRPVRRIAYLGAVPLLIGCLAGYATGATYASRYAAVVFPFLLLLAAVGVTQIRSRPVAAGVLAVLLLLGAIGSVRNVVTQRTDAGQNAAAINVASSPGDWVVYCPDQLGPSTSRLLRTGLHQATYPTWGAPERVDWVDYTKVLDRADPATFAQQLVDKAAGARIFLVYSTNYTTHRTICARLAAELAARRTTSEQVAEATDAFEWSSVVLYQP